jgi:hypothetical protein
MDIKTDKQRLAQVVKAARSITIRTAAIEMLARVVSQWLTAGLLGGVIVGRPRLGKTLGMRYVLRLLQREMGVTWCEIPTRRNRRGTTSEGAFYSYLLARHRHPFTGSSTSTKCDRLVELFVARAARSPLNLTVLFIDEAHYLRDLHYEYLFGLSNEVEAEGARLFCLFVGPTSLATRREELLPEHEEVVGRFMVDVLQYRGQTSLEELRNCLTGYDRAKLAGEPAESFVGFLAPKTRETGFKLESIAEPLWAAFVEAAKGAGGLPAHGIPMHYVHAAVVNLLSILDGWDFSNVDKAIASAVERSYYYGALQSLGRVAKTESKAAA